MEATAATEWSYGDSWERYPVQTGEIWTERKTGSTVSVHDLFGGIPAYMQVADLVYVDPPWNTGNLRAFYTKAGLALGGTFRSFLEALFDGIQCINSPVCYLEIGKQNLNTAINCLKLLYPVTQYWAVTYYRRNPSYLIRGGQEPTAIDFTGADDADTPRLAMRAESFSCVADLCMGRGLTATTAFALNKQFVGTELNPRRLAVTIDRVAQMGGEWCITPR